MTAPISMGTALPGPALPSMESAAADSSAATTYTDVNGLEALKRDPNSPEAIHAVAQQVEAMFLQMMLKSMRDASAADSPDSSEMGMYQDMFDKQVALSISQHTDIGIGRLLKKQLNGKDGPAGKGLTMGSPSASIGRTPADFINKILPSVRRAASRLGVTPEALLAQAALETGWGQRMPRNADGSSSYNMFGIKAGEDWTGARAAAATIEVIKGVAMPQRTAFRAYGSIEESVNDFAKLLANSPRYKEALAAGGDAQAYIASIGKSGYATDPDYANKLNQILENGTIQAALSPPLAKL